MTEEILTYDVMQLMEMIPHRYPFLLVDRITECVPGKYAKGYKNLTFNEEFFQGHFPGNPIMPGVLQLEALAQCSAPILMSLPGDRLEMHVETTKVKGPICKCHGVGYVDGKVAIEADLTVALK